MIKKSENLKKWYFIDLFGFGFSGLGDFCTKCKSMLALRAKTEREVGFDARTGFLRIFIFPIPNPAKPEPSAPVKAIHQQGESP
nr:MAG: hypothetical protein BECKLPF1236C_GA0070990_100611 [Candidatus Kentron sp. LPFa]